MTRHSLLGAHLCAARPTLKFPGRCELSLLSAALALALGALSTDASALSLGLLNVQSALGEPLRAEIDVTDVTAAEADGLKINIAPAAAFRAAGVNYNPELADLRTTVQRRADGRYVVRLSGARSVNDPFLDVLLEATWGAGHIARSYTVLLDPPVGRQAGATAVNPTPAQVGAQDSPRTMQPSRATAVTVPRPVRAQAPVAKATTVQTDGQQVTVQRGDTASKIAAAHKPADVSLDQMLVAMLRSNPQAFIGGNVNRMKAGAVLNLPGPAQADAVAIDEARRTVTAQSRDFSAYRRGLAENAPTSQVAGADRKVAGKLQANVEDRNAANASPDRLTISQGVATAAAQDKLAQSRQARETDTRVAELSKNLDDLNKSQAASGAAAATAAVISTPNAGDLTAAMPPPATPGAVAPGSASPAVAAGADATAPAPAAVDAKPAVAPAASTAPERSFIGSLLDNPVMLGAAALIALLLAFLLYRVMGRKRPESGDSVFLENRMPKDSFFGASSGESVDTMNENSGSSSVSYSPSQLVSGDVDPVAEADVYLAYGRDLQAEEILREALRTNPERVAIPVKLLEIHAKRHDLRAFEALATDVHKLTGGSGTDWNRVVELGRELDPGNPRYQHGLRAPARDEPTISAAQASAATAAAATAAAAIAVPMLPVAAEPVAAPPPAFVPSVAPLDFDFELSKPVPLPAAATAPVSASLPPALAAASQAEPSFVKTMTEAPRVMAQVAHGGNSWAPTAHSGIDPENDFDTSPAPLETITQAAALSSSDNSRTQPAPLRAELPGESGFVEFDTMHSLLDGGSSDTERGRLEPLGAANENPHAVKLSLARELQALGDIEGARSLIEEVAAESSGALRDEARQLLGQMR